MKENFISYSLTAIWESQEKILADSSRLLREQRNCTMDVTLFGQPRSGYLFINDFDDTPLAALSFDDVFKNYCGNVIHELNAWAILPHHFRKKEKAFWLDALLAAAESERQTVIGEYKLSKLPRTKDSLEEIQKAFEGQSVDYDFLQVTAQRTNFNIEIESEIWLDLALLCFDDLYTSLVKLVRNKLRQVRRRLRVLKTQWVAFGAILLQPPRKIITTVHKAHGKYKECLAFRAPSCHQGELLCMEGGA